MIDFNLFFMWECKEVDMSADFACDEWNHIGYHIGLEQVFLLEGKTK